LHQYSRRVKITPPESPYFVLSAPQFAGRSANLPASIVSSTTDGKVAPHATVQYTLTFKPQARADYSIDLVVVTEREKFLLPIRVFGDRAKLTFPGEIAFPKCPVKYPMQRPLLIGNTGTRGSRFHFLATAPFFVDPPDGYVGVDENVQVSVVFCPSAEGDFEGDLVITDDDNQTSLCRVFGSAECADVYLEVSELNCPPAYLDLVSQTSLKIVNKSLVPVRFDWKMFSSSEEDEHHRAMLCAELDDQEDAERRALEEHGHVASVCRIYFSLVVFEIFFNSLVLYRTMSVSAMTLTKSVSSWPSKLLRRSPANTRLVSMLTRDFCFFYPDVFFLQRLRAEINDGPLRFSDPNFSIEPAFGEIWPGGSVEVDVRFRPNIATMYGATAFCEVTGRVTRLPVLFKGNGIGPKAMFSYDTLDIGEVLIGGIYHYTAKIQNVGDIDAEYALLPSQGTSKSRFTFTPSSGVLVAEQVQEIAISFTCATLGPFSEVSEWSLPGRTEPMTITFRGQVVAPRFRFDRNELDFGQVSFGFLQSVTLSLSNESDIPFQFALSISDDGKYYGKEFGLTPSSGLIMPYEAQSIRVDFIAGSIKKYNNFLHVDAEGIGAALLRLPIKAECIVPTLSLSAEKLDFEKCFLRYGYTKTVELVNTSNLPAKFEVVFPEDINPMADSLTCDQAAGSIAPNSSVQLGIKMIARHLGPVSLALYVRTVGSEVPPKVIQATADGIGPILRLENSGLDFGLMPVLNAKTSVLKVHNDSPIPAAFKAFVTKKGSVFAVHPPVGRMEPNSSVDLRVIAYLDDNPKQTDVIHVVAEEGADYTATVAARGDGTTIKAETPIDQLRLGPVFTGQSLKKTFRLENQGRRAQTLSFEFVRRLVSDKSGKSTTSKPGTRPATGADVPAAAASAVEKKDATKAPKEAKTIFTITPDKITLQPFTAMIFTVEGTTNEAGITAEQWAIKSLVAGDKSPSVIMNPEFHGEFLTPLLESSAPKGLNFLYSFVPGVPIMPQMQQLTLTNVGALPLVFMFKCPVPFSVDRLECELASGESTTVTVQFDPGLNTTRVSEYIRQALVIVYRDHNQKDRIPLNGDICFPNLTLEKTAVDFGCVLNETQKRVTMVMTNHSRVAARYQWSFVEEVEVDGAPLIVPSSAPVAVVPNSSRSRRPPSASSTRAGSAASMRDTPTPTGGMSSSVLALQQQQNEKALAAAAAAAAQTYAVNEVFDVLPIRGFLQPGESEEVQFVFFGHPEVNMKTLAVCEVVGGPDYEVALHGEASSIIYRLDREKIEFGDQEFSQQRVQELVLQNLSRMPFNFTVNLSSFKYAHTVTVSPPMGLVKALEKQKILVTFFPGLPLEIIETFHVQVEYFDPIPIQVTGRGVFSQLLSSLPRVEQSDFQRHLAMASSQARFAQPLLPVLPVEPIPAARAPTASGTASGARPAGSPMAAKSNAQTAAPLTPRVNQTSAAELEAERLLFVEFLQKQKASFLAPTAAMNPSALLKAQSGDGV
jgi:hydrocephalus-inducing protein